MKTLYVVRHAEAAKKDTPIPDFERPLVKKGEKNAKDVARRLRKQGHNADLLISSPAKRAIETGHIFAKSLKYPVQQILHRDLLYETQDPGDVAVLLREQSNKHDSIMIFGHDPLFTTVVQTLTPEFTGDVPKSSVVAIQFDVNGWSDVTPGTGHVVYYDFPISNSKRDRMEKRARKELLADLTNRIESTLSGGFAADSKKIKKAARKAASAAADDLIKKDQVHELVWRELLNSDKSDTSTNDSPEPIKEEEVTS
jgi:phosphohistidine phosphatase